MTIMGGTNSKSIKIMNINGELFKLKPPANVFDIIKDYPDHVLLDSQDYLRFNLRAQPLAHETRLKPNRVYLLVELPKFPSPLRRAQSAVNHPMLPRVDPVKNNWRSVSDLPIISRSTMGSPVGPTRIKVKMPKAVVEKIMAESRDEVEVAERIIRVYLEEGCGGEVAEHGGGGGEERECVEDDAVDMHCFKVICSPCSPYQRKFKRLNS